MFIRLWNSLPHIFIQVNRARNKFYSHFILRCLMSGILIQRKHMLLETKQFLWKISQKSKLSPAHDSMNIFRSNAVHLHIQFFVYMKISINREIKVFGFVFANITECWRTIIISFTVSIEWIALKCFPYRKCVVMFSLNQSWTNRSSLFSSENLIVEKKTEESARSFCLQIVGKYICH